MARKIRLRSWDEGSSFVKGLGGRGQAHAFFGAVEASVLSAVCFLKILPFLPL